MSRDALDALSQSSERTSDASAYAHPSADRRILNIADWIKCSSSSAFLPTSPTCQSITIHGNEGTPCKGRCIGRRAPRKFQPGSVSLGTLTSRATASSPVIRASPPPNPLKCSTTSYFISFSPSKKDRLTGCSLAEIFRCGYRNMPDFWGGIPAHSSTGPRGILHSEPGDPGPDEDERQDRAREGLERGIAEDLRGLDVVPLFSMSLGTSTPESEPGHEPCASGISIRLPGRSRASATSALWAESRQRRHCSQCRWAVHCVSYGRG